MRRLKDIKAEKVSLVEVPAIRKKFYVIKEEKIMDELIELLKSFLGEVSEKEIELLKQKDLTPEAVDALKKALTLLSKFVGDFPDDVKAAITTLAKYATYGYPAPKKEADEEKERKAREAKEKQDREKTEKKFGDLEKQVKDLTDQIKKADDGLAGKMNEVKTAAEALDARVKKIEETPGIKKSLEGQVDDPEPGKWPSFFPKEE